MYCSSSAAICCHLLPCVLPMHSLVVTVGLQSALSLMFGIMPLQQGSAGPAAATHDAVAVPALYIWGALLVCSLCHCAYTFVSGQVGCWLVICSGMYCSCNYIKSQQAPQKSKEWVTLIEPEPVMHAVQLALTSFLRVPLLM